jgi:hypothetical protein
MVASPPMPRRCYTGPPATLGNMRAQGVRSIEAYCYICHHSAVLNVDQWPDAFPLPSFGARMVCTGCGIVGADVRANWKERPPRPTLTGEQWH